jgi:hypothetical protein
MRLTVARFGMPVVVIVSLKRQPFIVVVEATPAVLHFSVMGVRENSEEGAAIVPLNVATSHVVV